MKILAVNKRASFEYFIEERFECGIVLEGSEVKSLRLGNISLSESFALIRENEMWLKNAHIAPYEKSSAYNTKDPKRDRKLLLHKSEINKLLGKVNQKGYTVVPLKVYFKESLIKVEIGLCKGKQLFDKRHCIAERESDRRIERELKQY